jgi:hypothetical protein
MNGTIRGYVVSHPAISGPLTVIRNGREVPAFSFVMALRLTNSAGVVGLEVIRGRGEMRVYYHPEGVGEIGVTEEGGAGEVELDEVRFQAELDFQTGTYLIRLHELTQVTKAFTYAGQNQRTPEGRRAQDIMYGEVAFDLRALAVASSITLASSTPASRFLSLSKKGSF